MPSPHAEFSTTSTGRWASTGRIVAARYAGRLGAPALFTREHFAALAALTGEEGARDLIHADPTRVAAVDLPELAHDLDTPEDLIRRAP